VCNNIRMNNGSATQVKQAAYRDKRVQNLTIDSFIILLIFYLVSSFVFSMDVYAQSLILREYIFIYILTFLYYFSFELLFHKTPGKFITKTKVVMKDGSPADQIHIFLRSLIRLIPFDVLSFTGSYPVGWHDKFSETIVIDQYPHGKLPAFIETIIKILKILLYVVIALAVLLLMIGIGMLAYKYWSRI
jgi:uncharacterized RDD family membrane protein YckC